jgi:hypothetical protein
MNDYETQDELESRWKETVVTYFTALPQTFTWREGVESHITSLRLVGCCS